MYSTRSVTFSKNDTYNCMYSTRSVTFSKHDTYNFMYSTRSVTFSTIQVTWHSLNTIPTILCTVTRDTYNCTVPNVTFSKHDTYNCMYSTRSVTFSKHIPTILCTVHVAWHSVNTIPTIVCTVHVAWYSLNTLYLQYT